MSSSETVVAQITGYNSFIRNWHIPTSSLLTDKESNNYFSRERTYFIE